MSLFVYSVVVNLIQLFMVFILENEVDFLRDILKQYEDQDENNEY